MSNRNDECFFNTVWLLKLSKLQWIRMEYRGEVPSTRYNHCSSIIDTKMIVFGGMNGQSYARGYLQVCELQRTNV